MRPKPGEELAIRPNKSQLKRDATALRELGEQLTTATAGKIAKCALPEELLAALAAFRKLPNSHGAQRRQLQFIGKLMRELDDETVERIHNQLNLNVEMEKRRFHQIEELRDHLLNGDNNVLTEVLQQYPQFDAQLLGQLVRQTRKEQEQSESPPSARKLFRYLREKMGN